MEQRQIGRYEIKREIGRGGMATVYLAHDPRFKRDVALKVLPRQFTHDPMFRARFEREAQTIASLEHHAIVPVYDFGEEAEQPFLVMRYMPGGTLANRISQGPFPPEEAEKIISRIGSALDMAHSKGIIHRDLKPENILFDQHKNAFLSDFGIVKLAQSTTTFTGKGIIGTPAYMSPEQAKGTVELDGRSDLYTLGVILFEMLSGRQPFQAQTPIGLALMHISEPIPPLRTINPNLPPDYEPLINRAMDKDRDNRFSTANELTRSLHAVISGEELPVLGGSHLNKTELLPLPESQLSLTSRLKKNIPVWALWLIPALLGILGLGWIVMRAINGNQPATPVPIALATAEDNNIVSTLVATQTQPSESATESTSLPTQTNVATANPINTAQPTQPPMTATVMVPPTRTPTISATLEPMLRISQNSVNVRSGPGTAYTAIATLKEGDTVRIIAQTSNGLWFNIEMTDSTTGWIAKSVSELVSGVEIEQVPVVETVPAPPISNTSIPPTTSAIPSQPTSPPAVTSNPSAPATNTPQPQSTTPPTNTPEPTQPPPPTREPTPTP